MHTAIDHSITSLVRIGDVAFTAVSAIPAPTRASTDLIALGRALDYAIADEKAAYAAFNLAPTEDNDRVAEAATFAVGTIVLQIEALSATTMEGLAVKRRAVAWCWGSNAITAEALAKSEQPSIDDKIVASVLRDLAALGEEV